MHRDLLRYIAHSRWFLASTTTDSVCPLWRRGIYCHVHEHADDAEDGCCLWFLVSLLPGSVEVREQAWPHSLHPRSAVAACCRHPNWSVSDSCDHLQWHADGSAATAAGDVRSTSMDQHRKLHDFHRLVGHVWQMWSLSASTVALEPCGHSRLCASCALRRYCCIRGQWLPDVPFVWHKKVICYAVYHLRIDVLSFYNDSLVTARIHIRRTD